MLAKRTYKNQITIPQAVIAAFPGIEYFDVKRRDEEIVLIPVVVNSKDEELGRIRDKIKKLGIMEKDFDDAVRFARRQH